MKRDIVNLLFLVLLVAVCFMGGYVAAKHYYHSRHASEQTIEFTVHGEPDWEE